MPANVPITAIGSASEGIIVADARRRNRKITPTTSTPAISSERCTSSIDAWIVSLRSKRICMSMPAGSDASKRGNNALISFTTSIVFARLAHDRHLDRGLAAVPVAVAHARSAVDHVRDVPHPDWRAVAVGDDL